MTEVYIHLFGKFEIIHNEHILHRLPCAKSQELFYYLILNRQMPHNREKLAHIFWAEHTSSDARKYLRKNLWQLQTVLSKFFDPFEIELFDVDSDWIQYCNQPQVSLDVNEFEKIFISTQGVRGKDLNYDQYITMEQAVNLYLGPLLEGCYQDWCIYEREKFQDMHLSILDKLMGYCEGNQKYEKGIEYGKKILTIDQARERTHARMIRLYHLSGHRTEALRQFEKCKQVLMEELNVEPSISTKDLYCKVVKDNASKSNHNLNSHEIDNREVEIQVNEVLMRIRNLISLQESIQEEILKEINNLE